MGRSETTRSMSLCDSQSTCQVFTVTPAQTGKTVWDGNLFGTVNSIPADSLSLRRRNTIISRNKNRHPPMPVIF